MATPKVKIMIEMSADDHAILSRASDIWRASAPHSKRAGLATFMRGAALLAAHDVLANTASSPASPIEA